MAGTDAKKKKRPAKQTVKETTHEKVKKAQHKRDTKKPPFYWSMPWNVIKEINRMGYRYTWKNIFFVYMAAFAVVIALGLGFKLSMGLLLIDMFCVCLIAPKFIMNSYTNKNEAARFTDVNTYIEQMLYAFANSHKVLTALQDVSVLYQDGPMREVIESAIETIQNPSEDLEDDVEEIALNIIAERYPNQYVRQLHRFMLKVEHVGGTFEAAIELLIQNRVNWQARTDYVIRSEKKKRSEILWSCICAVGLCLAMLYMLPSDVAIFDRTPVQISNAILIIFAIFIYEKADRKLALNLVDSKEERTLKECRRDYKKFVNYDKRRGFIQSIKFSLPPLLIGAVLLIAGLVNYNHDMAVYNAAVAQYAQTPTKELAAIVADKPSMGIRMFVGPLVLFALALFMEFQAELGHKTQKTRLRGEIQSAFPEWMLELSLLLQSDNVQVSIFKSLDTVRPVMQPELEKMIAAIEAHPADAEPFLEFCKPFELPNITTSMQMLYSLSIGSGGDAQKQIKNIVERNNRDMDAAERNRCDNMLAGMQTLFFAPVLVASVIMMIDMTMFLTAFMGSLNMTGVGAVDDAANSSGVYETVADEETSEYYDGISQLGTAEDVSAEPEGEYESESEETTTDFEFPTNNFEPTTGRFDAGGSN